MKASFFRCQCNIFMVEENVQVAVNGPEVKRGTSAIPLVLFLGLSPSSLSRSGKKKVNNIWKTSQTSGSTTSRVKNLYGVSGSATWSSSELVSLSEPRASKSLFLGSKERELRTLHTGSICTHWAGAPGDGHTYSEAKDTDRQALTNWAQLSIYVLFVRQGAWKERSCQEEIDRDL